MRIIKNVAAAAAFTAVVALVFGFDIKILFSLRQLALFALGTLLLCLPAVDFSAKKLPPPDVIGEAALYAGMLQSFLQLMAALSHLTNVEAFSQTVALNLRPVFYGLLLRAVLTGLRSKPFFNNSPAVSPMLPPAPVSSADVKERFVSLGLSRREAEVAALACGGLSNCEIAQELSITESTVKKHVSNIFAKLGISRREQLRALIFPQDTII